MCATADVLADDIVENLAKCEEDSRRNEVRHRFELSEDSENENGLERKEGDQEDEGYKLVQHVQRNVSVRKTVAGVPVTRPLVTGVESDVASADEEGSR